MEGARARPTGSAGAGTSPGPNAGPTRLAALALASTFAAPPAFAQGVLRVSAIPDEAPTELQRKFKPLGDYLKHVTGMDVQFIPVTR